MIIVHLAETFIDILTIYETSYDRFKTVIFLVPLLVADHIN